MCQVGKLDLSGIPETKLDSAYLQWRDLDNFLVTLQASAPASPLISPLRFQITLEIPEWEVHKVYTALGEDERFDVQPVRFELLKSLLNKLAEEAKDKATEKDKAKEEDKENPQDLRERSVIGFLHFFRTGTRKAHSNLLLFHLRSRTCERFEPWGWGSAKGGETITESFLSDFLPEFQYIPAKVSCVEFGPQFYKKDRFCLAWSALLLHLKLLQPAKSLKFLTEELLQSQGFRPDEKENLLVGVRKYVSLMHKMAQSGYKVKRLHKEGIVGPHLAPILAWRER